MPSPSILQLAGAQPHKETRYVPIYTDRFMNGYWPNRNVLRSPLSAFYSEGWHLGATDALLDGLNIEMSEHMTPIRRPGNPAWSTFALPGTALSFGFFHEITGAVRVFADTATNFYSVTPTSGSSIWAKSAGSGQTTYEGVATTLYFGNGVDNQKWNAPDFGSFGLGVWKHGIAAPTVAPVVNTVESGSAAVAWSASTVFSTMGLILDSNGNVQQIISVSLLGNTGNYGTTGNGQPTFSNIKGVTITESSGTPITWECLGQVGAWKPNTTYLNQQPIYDPVTNCVFTNFASGGQVSGSVKPNFNAVPGSYTFDGNFLGGTAVKWGNNGVVGTATGTFSMTVWKPSTAYKQFDQGGGPMLILEPTLIGPSTTQPVFLQAAENSGTSGSGYTPTWGTAAGQVAQDNQIQWVCLGSGTWQASTNYTAWAPGQLVFSVVAAANEFSGSPPVKETVFWVCTVSGKSGTSLTFPTTANYGDQIQDGGVTWTCVGNAMTWATGTKWYLPTVGFAPPTVTQPFGGASIVDSNNNVQYVTESGLSGSSAPTWSASIGILNNTIDNKAEWTCVAALSQNSITWTKGYGYCYAYKARAATDSYVTSPPPGLLSALGSPLGSASGAVSTASPTFQMAVGPNAGAVNYLTLTGSLDPQVDTISIFRTADGGATFFWLTDIANPAPVNGTPSTAVFADFLPDSPTASFPGLNQLVVAPLNHVNDPPPQGAINFEYHLGRLFCSVGATVFASAGPDVGNPGQPPGNPNEAFPPLRNWQFPSRVTRLLSTNAGLLVFTVSDIFLIAGGPSSATLFSQIAIPGIGLLSYNFLAVNSGVIYLYTSDRQVLSLEPSAGVLKVGKPIGNVVSAFDPTSGYMAFLNSGDLDSALFVSDGVGNWYRCNPNPAPDGSITGPVWSPKASIAGALGAIASVETSPGVHQLLIGTTAQGSPPTSTILARDSNFAIFTDNGDAYEAFFTIGQIVLANPGQKAECAFVTADYAKVGTQPQVSWLGDEISATNGAAFANISGYLVGDPPSLLGTGQPDTLFSTRYYFKQTVAGGEPPPIYCRHMQVKVDFGQDTVKNEMLSFTIFGAILQEK